MKNGINEVYSYLKQFKELYGHNTLIDFDQSSNLNCIRDYAIN